MAGGQLFYRVSQAGDHYGVIVSNLYDVLDPITGLVLLPGKILADTSGHAISFAQSLAATIGRSVTLVPVGTVGPYTTYAIGGSQVTPASLNVTI